MKTLIEMLTSIPVVIITKNDNHHYNVRIYFDECWKIEYYSKTMEERLKCKNICLFVKAKTLVSAFEKMKNLLSRFENIIKINNTTYYIDDNDKQNT
jgi:hypothetical protein